MEIWGDREKGSEGQNEVRSATEKDLGEKVNNSPLHCHESNEMKIDVVFPY